jgi:uncharacterized integral membrane protein (TIGR00698 family)
MKFNAKLLFLLGLIVVATGLLSPPLALTLGIVFGFSFGHPYLAESRQLSRFLLQASVVALGFGMNLKDVVHAGRAGFLYTAISISAALLAGWTLGRLLGVAKKASFLITIGTAICGGSAIAAIAPITQPDEEEMAMSLGTIFVLNSVALLLFPAIGFALHMSQTQFGLWAALAIHDTSSVVGAAARYGSQALEIGTTVKLTRALWIVPVAMVTAALTRRRGAGHGETGDVAPKAKVQWPWFILLFCLAAVAKTYLPAPAIYPMLSHLGRLGLAVVLFLIGTGISRETLRRAGVRPMLQGVALWAAVASASLLAIRAGWIAL